MLFKINGLWLILTLVSGGHTKRIRNTQEVYCYSTSLPEEHKKFATKTAYAIIKGTLNEADYKVQDCEPVKIWVLGRHGAIHPTETTIEELSKLADLHNAEVEPKLCEDDINLLKDWKWDDNKTLYPESLSNEGWKEMKTLAEEYKAAFADLFNSPESIIFRHTTEQRANESVYGFATALFNITDVKDDSSDSERLFKFYDYCPKWNDNNAELSEPESSPSQFVDSDLFRETVQQISDRLGLPLSVKQVENIWDMCRYDRAWDNAKLSPWCSAFTQAHLNILEYHDDIKLYYKTGHGSEINSRVACNTVVDLLDHLLIENADTPKVMVSIADATTLQLLLTALETHKDAVRPSTDDLTDMDKRKWKSSEMSPFASNLAVVRYNCSDEEHQVKFFLNQKPLTELDWCSDGVCTLNSFIRKYQSYRDADCEEYYCSETSGKGKIWFGVMAMAVHFILIYFY